METRLENDRSKGVRSPTRFVAIIIGIGFILMIQMKFSYNPIFEQSRSSRSDFVALVSSNTTSSTSENTSSTSEEVLFPETKFTHHVREVIGVIENTTLGKNRYWPEKKCGSSARIIVNDPFTAPSRIECKSSNKLIFCTFLRQLFASNTTIMPYNVSVAMHFVDKNKKRSNAWGQCISSSAAEGSFTMANFQDIQNQNKQRRTANGYIFKNTLPWEERGKLPIFRGHPRIQSKNQGEMDGIKKAAPMRPSWGTGRRRPISHISILILLMQRSGMVMPLATIFVARGTKRTTALTAFFDFVRTVT